MNKLKLIDDLYTYFLIDDLYTHFAASDFGIELYENYEIYNIDKFAEYYENNKDLFVYNLIEYIKELENNL